MKLFENTEIAFKRKSNLELRKAFWIFKLINYPLLVSLGSNLLKLLLYLKIPVKKIIKITIFNHFCGGVSIKDSQSTIEKLSEDNIGTILDYSVEGQETEENFDAVTEETISSIKRAHNDPKIPFCVFKISGIGRFDLLKKINSSSILKMKEKHEFIRIKERVKKICQKAYDLNVSLFIDAEESWIQNTIDEIANEMMTKFNKKKAIIYNTLQMYRWDRMAFLKQCLIDAKNKKYFLGLKIVRGAYLEKEKKRAQKLGYTCPIQKNKNKTDIDFDLAIDFCCKNINQIYFCAGTHNEDSTNKLLELIKKNHLIKNDNRIYFSQLLGMSDHISYNLANNNYNVAKYVPYGPIQEIIPYLIRRAKENTSIAGQTGRELKLIMKEIRRRNKEF